MQVLTNEILGDCPVSDRKCKKSEIQKFRNARKKSKEVGKIKPNFSSKTVAEKKREKRFEVLSKRYKLMSHRS